jgi:transcriptional regulator with XRE-family HTH domain
MGGRCFIILSKEINMSLNATIANIRKTNGLTQEEFAERLFVTRQAVSRWKNGETTPTLETLKKVAQIFNVSASELLGFEEPPVCQSCAMPLQSLEDFGTNADDTANTEYCSYCFAEGKFTHTRTIEEMIEHNLRFLDEFNAQNGTSFTPDQARSLLKLHLASLKRWKNQA